MWNSGFLPQLAFIGALQASQGLQTEGVGDLGDSVLTTEGVLGEGMLFRGQ